tara:strand:+ start:308 stop:733 length:426 start_codon:yes stop_codon:yes gene_type:complete
MPTKLTRLEIEIILDRPDECIVECSCQFYTDEMIAKYGDYNKTDEMITEVWEDVERQVYPEQKVWDSCDKIRWSLEDHKILPEELDEIDKMVLDDCLSGSTMDRAEDVSPQYHGKVRATAIRLIDKLEKLGVKFSWADRWY